MSLRGVIKVKWNINSHWFKWKTTIDIQELYKCKFQLTQLVIGKCSYSWIRYLGFNSLLHQKSISILVANVISWDSIKNNYNNWITIEDNCSISNHLYFYLRSFSYLESSFFWFKNAPIPLYLSRDKTKRQSSKI